MTSPVEGNTQSYRARDSASRQEEGSTVPRNLTGILIVIVLVLVAIYLATLVF